MAFGGQANFRGRGRPIRSVQWLSVFAVTVLLANLPTSTVSQVCPNGTYLHNETSQHNTAEATTSVWPEVPVCRNCNASVSQCVRCEFRNNSVLCQECQFGYKPTDNGEKCTTISPSPDDDTRKMIIIVVVVCSSLIVVVAIVGIVLGVRRGADCRCCCNDRSATPPPMPHPDELGLSFTSKKDDNQSGTGQRVDLRYTEEPGVTQPRVKSVDYETFGSVQREGSIYMNTPFPGVNIPTTVQEEHEDTQANADDQPGDLYINAGSSTQVNLSTAGKRGPPPPKPKPKPSTKSISEAIAKPGNRESLFPPSESEDIYTNEAVPEDDGIDYVNCNDYQPRKP